MVELLLKVRRVLVSVVSPAFLLSHIEYLLGVLVVLFDRVHEH